MLHRRFPLWTLCILAAILALTSCTTTSPTSPQGASIYKVYEGTYRAAKSSEGVMKNWVLYSNGLVTGDWVTKKNSRTLGIRGHWESIDARTIVFEASGDVSIFGLTLAKARISGLGQIQDQAIRGTFILFVDQDTQWADLGTFNASERNQEQ